MGLMYRAFVPKKFSIHEFIVNAKLLSNCTNIRETSNSDTVLVTQRDNTQNIESESKQFSQVVAVIGVPNAGKSTFINNIINHRICPTSSKVHTTRSTHKAIYTTGNTQLVFYDTPGLVTQREIKRHNLTQSFKSAYRHAIQNANMLAVIHDVSNRWSRNELHPTVLDTLKTYSSLPSILVLNKIDTLKSKRVLLELIRILSNNTLSADLRRQGKITRIEDDSKKMDTQRGWGHFSNIFLVSSITASGLNEIMQYLLRSAKERPWQYSSDVSTDATPEELIVESVRARLLDYLPQEIPYNLECNLEFYKIEKDTIYTSVEITCRSVRIERLICGQSNGKLRQITERVSSDLVEIFNKPVSLTLTTSSPNE